uniref:Uncharacterized protein n=1 Tax=Plectus sambesii TaxID=2011161 RepID=A0A914V6L4_9BILA
MRVDAAGPLAARSPPAPMPSEAHKEELHRNAFPFHSSTPFGASIIVRVGGIILFCPLIKGEKDTARMNMFRGQRVPRPDAAIANDNDRAVNYTSGGGRTL